MATIDALLGLGLEDGAETKALADSLRGRKRAADMFSLSTVGNIAQGAQREQEAIMEGAKRGGVLRQTMADRAAKKEQAENTLAETVRSNDLRNNAAWAAIKPEEYINDDGQTKVARMTPQGLMEADGVTPFDQTGWKKRDDPNAAGFATNQRAIDRAEDRRVDKLDLRMIKYGDAMKKSNLTRAFTDIGMVDNLLAKIPVTKNPDGTTSMGDIPGVGYAYNSPGFIGSMLTYASELNDDEGDVDASEMRGAIQRLLNTEIRTQSGAAVTLHEMLRNRIGSGVDVISSDEDFLKFWGQVKEVLAAEKGNYDNAYGPDVTGLYELRQSGEPITTRDFLSGNYQSGGGQTEDWMISTPPESWTPEQWEAFDRANQ